MINLKQKFQTGEIKESHIVKCDQFKIIKSDLIVSVANYSFKQVNSSVWLWFAMWQFGQNEKHALDFFHR